MRPDGAGSSANGPGAPGPDAPGPEAFGPATDELLDTGPRRRVPRAAVLVLVAVLVAAAVLAVVLSHRRDAEHRSAEHRSAEHRTAAVPSTTSTPTSAPTGPSVSGEVNDLVADPDDGRVIALVGDRLAAYDAAGRLVAVGTSGVQVGGGPESQVDLSFDPARQVVWAVREGLPLVNPDAPGLAEAFSARTLGLLGRTLLPGPADGSAALGGRLYVSADGRLWSATPGAGRFVPVAAVGDGAGNLVADPARHRVLFVEFGARLALGAVSLHRPVRVTRPRPLPFDAGEVGVVGSTIWAVGTAAEGAVVARVDPATLRAGRNLAPGLRLGAASAVLGGTGQRSLFVRPVQGASTQLLCLDGRTGALRRRFVGLTGLFVTLGHRGYQGIANGVTAVSLDGCPG